MYKSKKLVLQGVSVKLWQEVKYFRKRQHVSLHYFLAKKIQIEIVQVNFCKYQRFDFGVTRCLQGITVIDFKGFIWSWFYNLDVVFLLLLHILTETELVRIKHVLTKVFAFYKSKNIYLLIFSYTKHSCRATLSDFPKLVEH